MLLKLYARLMRIIKFTKQYLHYKKFFMIFHFPTWSDLILLVDIKAFYIVIPPV